MRIVSISRGSHELGMEFAKSLASRLGYECIGREDLLEEATRRRIPIGKLETAIVKPHIYSERLAFEMEHYKALATSILCEKALDHDIVYHGRTGHLLLPGIDNVLRIKVVGNMEHRIATVMERLRLSRKKAKQYIEAVEGDRKKWVRNAYDVDWDGFDLYDLVLNLGQVTAGNAASAACAMAQLPEFQPTPVTTNALTDLLLAAKAKLALFSDDRTRRLSLKIMAAKGTVYVTYGFQQADRVDAVTEVIRSQTAAREVVCTEAQTNLLWIQEGFDPDDSSYQDVLNLANSWDAAVEIVKMIPGKEFVRYPVEEDVARNTLETWRETGIIDEREEFDTQEPDDVARTYERLVNDGRAGGRRKIEGSQKALIGAIDRSREYRLVILDNLFLEKTSDTRKRMVQEWSNALSEALRTPVVSLGELRSQYRFGAKQLVQMVVLGVLAALIIYSVLHYGDQVMAFIHQQSMSMKIVATASVLVFVPLFASIYGTAVGLFLRMIKLE